MTAQAVRVMQLKCLYSNNNFNLCSTSHPRNSICQWFHTLAISFFSKENYNNNNKCVYQCIYTLHQLVHLFGMDFPLQSVPPSYLVVYPHLSLTSTPVFSLGVKHT